MKLKEYIGETTTYDKKLMLERSDPISWLKSVSAFANTRGGKLIFGVGDDGELAGLENAFIHRDYLVIGSEVHVDVFDDRLEIYSPGGMPSGELVQSLDMRSVPSERRNPVIADLFQRLLLMERRGSGFKKFIGAYQAESQKRGKEWVPEFRSSAKNFFVVLPNLNYGANLKGVQNDCVARETEVATEVTAEVATDAIKKLLLIINGSMAIEEMMRSVSIRGKEGFRKRYLKPAVVSGFVEMTQPDSPRSPTQKYRLTERGKRFVGLIKKDPANLKH